MLCRLQAWKSWKSVWMRSCASWMRSCASPPWQRFGSEWLLRSQTVLILWQNFIAWVTAAWSQVEEAEAGCHFAKNTKPKRFDSSGHVRVKSRLWIWVAVMRVMFPSAAIPLLMNISSWMSWMTFGFGMCKVGAKVEMCCKLTQNLKSVELLEA